MLSWIFSLCLCLGLSGAGASLSCRWVDHRFRQYSENSLDLLDSMAKNSTNATKAGEMEDVVAFPNHLYSQASTASAKDKLGFAVQILEELSALFEEDHSSASWEEITMENFINVVSQQADGLGSCIGSPNHKKAKKLQMYFKRLSSHVLRKMDHSAEAWELIRREIKTHLMRINQLVSSLLSTN